MKKVDLPDFDDMVALANDIGGLKTSLMLLEGTQEQLKADITETVTTDPTYWGSDKKSPSNAHIKDTFHVNGFDEGTRTKLENLRTAIATTTGELRTKENIFRIYESMIGVWRTQSANDRYDNA